MVTLEEGKKKLQQEYSELFDQSGVTRSDLKKYKETEQKLLGCEISLHKDTEKIVNILENLDNTGPDPREVAKELAEVKNFRQEKSVLQRKVADLRSDLKRKGHEYQVMELKIATHRPLLTICDDLE
jgi:hypothetical protein